MQYAILIYRDEEKFHTMTQDEGKAMLGSYMAYTRALKEAGAYVAGEPLQVSTTATTIRIREDQRTVQDGPYADLKEQLGGFFLIDCPDLDTALEWGARCPAAVHGTVEVRPLMVLADRE